MNSINVNFNFEELYILFGKEALYNFNHNVQITNVSTDTRTIINGDTFFAIKGENFDGHDYINTAIDSGASLIISQKEIDTNLPYILVKDSVEALGTLANHHRKKFSFPVIAIAGSNGKTTTKEITSLVLSKKFNVCKTEKNYNNKIGTAFTLLSFNESHSIAVVEIGTSAPGEIYYLSKLVEPTHTLITNIGKEHLEFLIDSDGVEMEETALYAWSRQNSAVAFINVDDIRLRRYVKVLEKRVMYGEHEQANVKLEYSDLSNPKITLRYEESELNIKLKNPGLSNVMNSTAAATIGIWLEVDQEKIIEALEEYEPADDGYARLKVIEKDNYKIINDTYNANPESMIEALNVLKYQVESKKIAVLGDMREMGKESAQEHINILKLASEISHNVLLIGDEFKRANQEIEAANIDHYENQESLLDNLRTKLNPETVILFKGSRGLKIENLILSL